MKKENAAEPRATFPWKKVLVVAPHPDDEIICSGGLICRAVAQGAHVRVLYGSIGPSRQLVTGQTNEQVRVKEAQAVAKACGFTHKFLFIGNEFMRMDAKPQKDLIELVEDEVQSFAPDLAVIPFGGSFDQDHRAWHTACMTALRPTPRKVRHFVPTVLECEEPLAWGSEQRPADFFVDVTGFLEAKENALKLHASQLREEPFGRSIENLRRQAGMRGAEIGGFAAEAFYCRRNVV